MEKKYMSEEERNARIIEARKLIYWEDEDEYQSDQMLRRKQPPLVKAPMTDLEKNPPIELPRDFSDVEMKTDLVSIFLERRSSRVYTEGDLSLGQLSFLLWSTQGIKTIRGKRYATIRTVPSGGARHPFETYPLILHVEGVTPGLYHYLPMTHTMELLTAIDPDAQETKDMIAASVCGQKWALKSSVIFFYSIIPYRGEWRYAHNSHRVMMMDAGHVTENLYIACSGLGIGTCAIGACDPHLCDEIFGLDGKEEYMFYCAPVGTIDSANEAEEQSFYAFLKEEEQYYE